MATKGPSAQELDTRVSFAKRIAREDGYGNTVGAFEVQFSRWAALRHRGGSESVQAARLEGRNVISVYVRSDRKTREITSDWQMSDRAGNDYAIVIVDALTDRRFVFLQAESGVAA